MLLLLPFVLLCLPFWLLPFPLLLLVEAFEGTDRNAEVEKTPRLSGANGSAGRRGATLGRGRETRAAASDAWYTGLAAFSVHMVRVRQSIGA